MSTRKITDKEESPTSPRGVAKDVLASMILVSGALCVEWIKSLFTEGAPTLIVIILNLSEITLMLGFVVALLRAIANIYLEFDGLIRIIRKKGSFRAIVEFYRTTDRTRPTTFEIVRECASAGVVFAFAVGFLGILTVWFSSLSTVWLTLLIVIGIGLALFAFRIGGVFGVAVSSASFDIAATLIPFAILLLVAIVVLIFRLLGQNDLLQSVVNYLFLRR